MPLSPDEFEDELNGLSSEDEFGHPMWIYFAAENEMEADEIWSLIKSILTKYDIGILDVRKGKLFGDIVHKFRIDSLPYRAKDEIENINQKIDKPRITIL